MYCLLDIFSSPFFICLKWSCSTNIFGVKNKQGSCGKHTHRVMTGNLNIYMWQCFAGRKMAKETSHGNIYLLMNQYWRGLENKEFYMWQCCSKPFSNFHWLMLKKIIKKTKKRKTTVIYLNGRHESQKHEALWTKRVVDLPLGKFSYSINLIFKEWPQSFCLYFLATARSIGPKKKMKAWV